jgi:hypothetical protein
MKLYKARTCHDFHGFEWKNINISLILTHFVHTLFDLLDFEYTQIQNLHGINLSVKIWKIQIMIIYMVVAIFHMHM